MSGPNLPERTSGASPFDQIRQTRPDGTEFWSARDLMVLMSYAAWQNFQSIVTKAWEGAKHVGLGDVEHFMEAHKVAASGPPAKDVHLSRLACYLVTLAADEGKPRVAEAKLYFAVKTREAEVAPVRAVPQFPVPTSFAAALQLAATQALELEEKDRQIEDQRAALDWAEPRAAYVDKYVDGAVDANTVRDTAKQLDVPERKFRQWLIRRELIYRMQNGEYRARAMLGPRRHWFILQDQPQAPRHHNGQVRKTLYITPAGKVGIESLLAKYPILGQGEFDIDEREAS